MPHGHTGLWPRHRRKPRQRIIACFDGSLLTDEYGQAWEIHSYEELRHVLFSGGYDLYVADLLSPDAFPYLLDAIADQEASVLASPSGGALGIRLRSANESRSIGVARSWNSEIGGPFTRFLRGLFEYVGIGTYATPGALGEALWATLRSERMCVPNAAAARDLRENAFGGRADTIQANKKFAFAYEIDLRSAYVALSARVPTGTATRIVEETSHERYACGTYYARCRVQLPDRRLAAFGPVPYRPPLGRGEPSALQYPTTGPFEFEAWLWREEVQRARKLGISVSVRDGWSWPWWDSDNRAWIEHITTLRREARLPLEDDWLKRAAVAAIGRQATPPLTYEILWYDDPRLTEDDMPLPSNTGEPPITGAWLHCEPDPNPPPRLPHVWNYVSMRCRVALYDRMELERKAGNRIISTNFDSILLEQASSLPTGNGIGEWREQLYHEAIVPRPRSLISREKVRLPGVRKDRRAS